MSYTPADLARADQTLADINTDHAVLLCTLAVAIHRLAAKQ